MIEAPIFVIKTDKDGVYWFRNRQMDRWSRKRCEETYPSQNGKLIYNKDSIESPVEMVYFLLNRARSLVFV